MKKKRTIFCYWFHSGASLGKRVYKDHAWEQQYRCRKCKAIWKEYWPCGGDNGYGE